MFKFSSVQSLSQVQLFMTPWTEAHQASLTITDSQSLLKLMSIELVMSSNHLILCHPLILLSLIFPNIRVFSNESVLCIRWPKYWNFSFSINPYNEYSGLISFRIDWFDLCAGQVTLKSLWSQGKPKSSFKGFTCLGQPHIRSSPFWLTQSQLIRNLNYICKNPLASAICVTC